MAAKKKPVKKKTHVMPNGKVMKGAKHPVKKKTTTKRKGY